MLLGGLAAGSPGVVYSSSSIDAFRGGFDLSYIPIGSVNTAWRKDEQQRPFVVCRFGLGAGGGGLGAGRLLDHPSPGDVLTIFSDDLFSQHGEQKIWHSVSATWHGQLE